MKSSILLLFIVGNVMSEGTTFKCYDEDKNILDGITFPCYDVNGNVLELADLRDGGTVQYLFNSEKILYEKWTSCFDYDRPDYETLDTDSVYSLDEIWGKLSCLTKKVSRQTLRHRKLGDAFSDYWDMFRNFSALTLISLFLIYLMWCMFTCWCCTWISYMIVSLLKTFGGKIYAKLSYMKPKLDLEELANDPDFKKKMMAILTSTKKNTA